MRWRRSPGWEFGLARTTSPFVSLALYFAHSQSTYAVSPARRRAAAQLAALAETTGAWAQGIATPDGLGVTLTVAATRWEATLGQLLTALPGSGNGASGRYPPEAAESSRDAFQLCLQRVLAGLFGVWAGPGEEPLQVEQWPRFVAALGEVGERPLARVLSTYPLATPTRGPEASTCTLPAGLSHGVRVEVGEVSHVMLAYTGLHSGDEDRHALHVLWSALDGEGGLLYRALREERPLAYASRAYSKEYRRLGYIVLYASCLSREADVTLRALLCQLADLRRRPLSRAQLERARQRLLTAHYAYLQGGRARARFAAVQRALGQEEHAYARRVRSVTAEDVCRVARQVFARAPEAVGKGGQLRLTPDRRAPQGG